MMYTLPMGLKILLALLQTAQIALLVLAMGLRLRRAGTPLAAALAYAALLSLATLSLLIQVFFLLGVPRLYPLADLALIGLSVREIVRERATLRADRERTLAFLGRHRGPALALGLPVVYLFLQAFLAPPANGDSMVYNLARVLMFGNERSLFLHNCSTLQQSVFAVGHDLLPFLFLRWHVDFGLALFSFAAYLTVIAATWSMVRSGFGEKSAVAVTFMVASLTGLVLQATTTKNDIPCAGAALVVFLAGFRFQRSGKTVDLFVMLTGLLWGLTVKNYFAAFAGGFALFFVLFHRPFLSPAGLFRRLRERPARERWPLLLPLGLALGMALFLGANARRYGGPFGSRAFVDQHRNRDGIAGGLFNAGRYLLQAMEIPTRLAGPVRRAHDRLLGERRFEGMRDPRDAPAMSLAGSFVSEDYSWYGPLAFWLGLPAVIWAAAFGRGYPRLVGLTLLFFFAGVCLQVAWMPWNSRFFSLFFASSGLCLASLLNRLKPVRQRLARGLLIGLSVYGLLGAALQNDLRPTLPRYRSTSLIRNLFFLGRNLTRPEPLPATWLGWIKDLGDRAAAYRRFVPARLFQAYLSELEPGRRVLILAGFSPVFPLLFSRPDLRATVARPEQVYWEGRLLDPASASGTETLRRAFDAIVVLGRDARELPGYEWLKRERTLGYSRKGALFLLRR